MMRSALSVAVGRRWSARDSARRRVGSGSLGLGRRSGSLVWVGRRVACVGVGSAGSVGLGSAGGSRGSGSGSGRRSGSACGSLVWVGGRGSPVWVGGRVGSARVGRVASGPGRGRVGSGVGSVGGSSAGVGGRRVVVRRRRRRSAASLGVGDARRPRGLGLRRCAGVGRARSASSRASSAPSADGAVSARGASARGAATGAATNTAASAGASAFTCERPSQLGHQLDVAGSGGCRCRARGARPARSRWRGPSMPPAIAAASPGDGRTIALRGRLRRVAGSGLGRREGAHLRCSSAAGAAPKPLSSR